MRPTSLSRRLLPPPRWRAGARAAAPAQPQGTAPADAAEACAGRRRRRPTPTRPTAAAIRSSTCSGTDAEPKRRRPAGRRRRRPDGRRNLGARRHAEPRRAGRDGAGPRQQDLHRSTGRQALGRHVKAVTPQGLVIVQDVNDPLSIEKTARGAEAAAIARGREGVTVDEGVRPVYCVASAGCWRQPGTAPPATRLARRCG